MKKILIEKTRSQKKKSGGERKTVIKIILCTTVLVAVVFCAILLGMDFLMRAVAPDIYLGGRVLNTYKQLEKEQKQNSDFFEGLALPEGDLNTQAAADFGKISFNMEGGFNKDSKKTYFAGDVNTDKGRYGAEFFYNDGVSGVCLPEFLDVWLCTQNDSIFNAMYKTGVSEKLGIPIIPANSFADISPDLGSIYPELKTLLSDIKISGFAKKSKGLSEYVVTVNGDAVKNILLALSDSLNEKSGTANLLDMNILKSYISEIPFPEKVQFTVYERKKAVVYASSKLYSGGEELQIHIDMSKNARLSDSLELKLLHTMDGTSYGFVYNSNGDKANPRGQICDSSELSLALPFVENISVKRDIVFSDKKNFTYSINANSNGTFELSLKGKGIYTASEFGAEAEQIILKAADIELNGKGRINFVSDNTDFEIPQREQFELDTIPQDTLKRLTDGISLFLKQSKELTDEKTMDDCYQTQNRVV